MYGPETFVVRVEGHSMEPRFRDGEYAYVDPDEPAVDGCFVGVADAKAETMVIRQLGRENGQIVLRTLNPCRIERVLDKDSETMIQGVALFVVRRV